MIPRDDLPTLESRVTVYRNVRQAVRALSAGENSSVPIVCIKDVVKKGDVTPEEVKVKPTAAWNKDFLERIRKVGNLLKARENIANSEGDFCAMKNNSMNEVTVQAACKMQGSGGQTMKSPSANGFDGKQPNTKSPRRTHSLSENTLLKVSQRKSPKRSPKKNVSTVEKNPINNEDSQPGKLTINVSAELTAEDGSSVSPTKDLDSLRQGRRIRSPSIRYADDMILFPLKTPRRSRSPKGDSVGASPDEKVNDRESLGTNSVEKSCKTSSVQTSQLYSLLTGNQRESHDSSKADDTSNTKEEPVMKTPTRGRKRVSQKDEVGEKSSSVGKKGRGRSVKKSPRDASDKSDKSDSKSVTKIQSGDSENGGSLSPTKHTPAGKSGAVRELSFETSKPAPSDKSKLLDKPCKSLEEQHVRANVKKSSAKKVQSVKEDGSDMQKPDSVTDEKVSNKEDGNVKPEEQGASKPIDVPLLENVTIKSEPVSPEKYIALSCKSQGLFDLISKVKNNMDYEKIFPGVVADVPFYILEDDETDDVDHEDKPESESRISPTTESTANDSIIKKENSSTVDCQTDGQEEIVDDFFSADFLQAKKSPVKKTDSPSKMQNDVSSESVEVSGSAKKTLHITLTKQKTMTPEEESQIPISPADVILVDKATSSSGSGKTLFEKFKDKSEESEEKDSDAVDSTSGKVDQKSTVISEDKTGLLMIDTQERRNIFDAIMSDYSPREKGKSREPITKSQSPQMSDKTPQKLDKSPQKLDMSSQKLDKSPQKLDISPQSSDKSPQKLDKSPQKLDKSPQKLDISPQSSDKSPQKLDRSPQKLDISPQSSDKSPQQLDKSPQKLDISPQSFHKSPQKLDTSPQKLDKSPQKLNSVTLSSDMKKDGKGLNDSEKRTEEILDAKSVEREERNSEDLTDTEIKTTLKENKSIVEHIQEKLGLVIEEYPACSRRTENKHPEEKGVHEMESESNEEKPVVLEDEEENSSKHDSSVGQSMNVSKESSDFEICMGTVDEEQHFHEMDDKSEAGSSHSDKMETEVEIVASRTAGAPLEEQSHRPTKHIPNTLKNTKIVKEPAPLSVLTTVEEKGMEKTNAFMSTKLDDYLLDKSNLCIEYGKQKSPVKQTQGFDENSQGTNLEESGLQAEELEALAEEEDEDTAGYSGIDRADGGPRFSSIIEECDPDFDEVDGVLFISFPNEESLSAHLRVEQKSKIGKSEKILLGMARMKNIRQRQKQIRQSAHKKSWARLKSLKAQFKIEQSLQGMHLVLAKYQRIYKRELVLNLLAKEEALSQKGLAKLPEKTADVTKIKGWKNKFGETSIDSPKSDSLLPKGKLHWKTEESLLKSLHPDELREYGFDLKKKRRKNLIFTIRKGMSKGDGPGSKTEKVAENLDGGTEEAEHAEEEGVVIHDGLDTEEAVGEEGYAEPEEELSIYELERRKMIEKKNRDREKKYLMKKLKMDSMDIEILKKLGGQVVRKAVKNSCKLSQESQESETNKEMETNKGVETNKEVETNKVETDKEVETNKADVVEIKQEIEEEVAKDEAKSDQTESATVATPVVPPVRKKRFRRKNTFQIVTVSSQIAHFAIQALDKKFKPKKRKGGKNVMKDGESIQTDNPPELTSEAVDGEGQGDVSEEGDSKHSRPGSRRGSLDSGQTSTPDHSRPNSRGSLAEEGSKSCGKPGRFLMITTKAWLFYTILIQLL